MNLRAIVAGYVNYVNPLTWGQVLIAGSGYTTTEDGTRVPSYNPPIDALMDIQSLSMADVQKLNGLDQQGSTHKVYVSGRLEGLIRRDNKGSDLIRFPMHPGEPNRTWLVTSVLEDWPDWSCVSVTLQNL